MAFESDIHRFSDSSTDRMSSQGVHRLLKRAELLHVWNAHDALDMALEALELSETLSYRSGLAASLALCSKCHTLLGDSSRALAEAETALKLFESEDDVESLLECQCTLAGAYALMGDFFQALHILEDTAHAEASAKPSIRFRIQFTQGGVYQSLAEYAKALTHFHEALLIGTDAHDERGRAAALSSLGSVYFDLGEYATSISFYQQSMAIYQQEEDKGGEAWTLERMGTLCTRMGGLEDALAFHHRSMVLRRESNNHRGVAGSLFYIGEILNKQGLEDQAVVMFKESLKFWENAHDYVGMAETYLAFADLHLNEESEQFNTMRATELLVKCLRIAQELGLKRLEMRVHETFTVAYKQIRLFEKALSHKEKAIELREIISGEDVSKQVQQLEIALRRERFEREIEQDRKESAELATALQHLDDLNAHLQHVAQEKNEVFSIVYHDLKNPIAGILVHTSTLERYLERMSMSEIRNSITSISKTAHRMKDIVTHLLQGNSSQPQSVVIEPMNVNLTNSVRDALDDLSARAYAKSQSIRFDGAEHEHMVVGDRVALQRCVENLVSNAIKYSPNNTTITLSVRESVRDGFVRFTVTDQGPGIAPDRLRNIFTGTVKGGSRTTGGEDSTGIGLVSVKRLIEKMHGTVHCTSEVGVGSSFYFDIPKNGA